MSGPVRLDAEVLGSMPLPVPPPDDGKEGRGRALVFAGGGEVPGAAVLAGLAVLRSGAGKLQMAAGETFAMQLAFAVPEARVLRAPQLPSGELAPEAAEALSSAVERTDALVIGPGMIDEAAAGDLAGRLLRTKTDAAYVADAAALTGLQDLTALRAVAGRAVITPHMGEMARLLDHPKEKIEADPVGIARSAAAAAQCVAVLKGATTWIASPDGQTFVNEDGAIGLGTGGSGDVLAGLLGGLLARGAPPVTAACWAVYLHALAGASLSERVAPLGFLAREIPDEIPRLMAKLCR